MLLPGKVVLSRRLLTNIRCPKTQVQPCGIDLSLKKVSNLISSASIDFDNSRRRTSDTSLLAFQVAGAGQNASAIPSIHLTKGAYLVEFNETATVPNDLMGQIFVRSSLFRSGALLHTGVVDAGYSGVLGAMLKVENEHGLHIFEHARLAQIVFSQMTETTGGYAGQYQGRSNM